MVAGLTPTVASWSDTAITFTVPSSAVTGVVKIQRSGLWSNAVTFTVPSGPAPQITLSPNVIVLTVGETRTLQALQANGSVATGLTWTSTNPAVASLSTDDPPVITAIAPGNVTIKAGSAAADLTIYNAGEIPLGTTLWSVPGPAAGVAEIKIAVPNYDAVADVFAIGTDQTVQAITSDGTVAWTAASPIAFPLFVPDFQGGLLAHNSESIYRLHPLTGAATPLYTNANDETVSWGLTPPAIHTDGTVFTVDYACHDACGAQTPDAEDGAWVVGINAATGAQKFRVKLKNWTFTSYEPEADFCAPGVPSVDVLREHPWPNNAIKIAGDGYAYLSYFTIDFKSTNRKPPTLPFSADAYAAMAQLRQHLGVDWTAARADLDAVWAAAGWSHEQWNYSTLVSSWENLNAVQTLLTPAETMLRPICDVTGTDVWQMHLMRVGPDGSSTDVVAKEWRNNFSRTFTVSAEYPFWHETRLNSYPSPDGTLPDNPLRLDFSENIITDADQGALFSWQAMDKYGRGEPENHLTTMHGSLIVSDVVWAAVTSSGDVVEPVMQFEDGTFAGSNGDSLLVFDRFGQVSWSISGYYPQVAVLGGGLLARSGSTNVAFSPVGEATGHVNIAKAQSWLDQSYDLFPVRRVSSNPILRAKSIWPQDGGNQSGTGRNLPVFVTFSPLTELGTVQPYSAQMLAQELDTTVRGKAVSQPVIGSRATVAAYKTALVGNFAAVGFVGHSTLGNGPEYPSIGLHLFDKNLVKWPAGVENPQLTNNEPADWVQQTVPHNATILFFGACALGTEFSGLWNIDSNTKGSAMLLVREQPHTKLNLAGKVWVAVVDELVTGSTTTAEQAKDRGNGEAIVQGWPSIQWDVVGDKNITVWKRP